MRRFIVYSLLLLISAETAYAQARGGRAGTPTAGGGRGVTAPAVAPNNAPVSVPPIQGPPIQQAKPKPEPVRRWMWRAEMRHDGNPLRRRGGSSAKFEFPSFNGIGYFPPFHEFGYTYTLPYLDPVPEVPANQAIDWLAPATELPAPAPADPAPPGRISSPDQKSRAGRYVSYGDKLFAQQKYLAALGRYKSATEAASDMAEAHLRQSFAYVAMGQFENASKALRRGLALRSNWQGTAIRLSTLYDGAEAAKTQHIEKLALAVEENPFDSGLLMTLGVELFFDGQFDRAELCFQNAARLGGGDEALVADFLPGAKPVGAPAPAKTRKVTF